MTFLLASAQSDVRWMALALLAFAALIITWGSRPGPQQ